MLEAVDEATERGDAESARQMLQQGESLVRSSLDRALVDVRWAFLPGWSEVGDAELDRALLVLSEYGEDAELARAYGAIGSLRMDREDPVGAAEVYLRAEQSYARLGDHSGILRSRLNRSAAIMSAGRLREAATLLGQIEEDARRSRLPDRDLIRALAATNLAAAALSLQQTAEADLALRRARRLYSELGMPLRAATAVFNQAFQASHLGDFEVALILYGEAEELLRQGGDQAVAMMARRGQGAMLARLGRREEALTAYREALSYFDRAGLLREGLRTATGLAALYAEAEPDRAVALISDRLTDQVRSDRASQPDVAEALRNLGNLASAAGHRDEAWRAYQDATKIWRAAGRPAEVAMLLANQAVLADTMGHSDDAVELGESALSAFREAGMSGLELAHAQANLAVAIRHAAAQGAGQGQGRQREALGLALTAVAEVDRHRYGLVAAEHRTGILDDRERTVYTTAVDTALWSGDLDALAGVMEAARAHGIPDPAQQGPPGLSRWLQGMPFALLNPAEEGEAIPPRQRVTQIRQRFQRPGGRDTWWVTGWIDRRLITVAALGSATTLAHRQPLDIDAYLALQACLGVTFRVDKENASRRRGSLPHIVRYRAAVGPLLGDPVVAADSAQWLSEAERAAIRDHPVTVMANELGETGLLWRLAQQVLPEALRSALLDRVTSGDRATLEVAPIGLIGHVPWGLLPLREPADREDVSTPRVFDAADIVYTPPVSFLLATGRSRPNSDGAGTMVVADPLSDLPHARAHARPGARILGGAWLGDPARLATRARLLDALARGPRPAVVVIAAHVDRSGSEDLADAAILLAAEDGGEDPLTARTIYREMKGSPSTCLLFGCESLGIATGYEWTGLAMAMLWAGTRQVTGALWPTLDDPATTACERRLVDAMVADPWGGYATYLADSAQAWRQNPGLPENRPYRWAGYGLVRGQSWLPRGVTCHGPGN